MEAMTLEQVRDAMYAIHDEERPMPMRKEAREWAAIIGAHLAQPAQAVDVGADFGAMNSALCAFAMRWEIDGDYMRCLKCKRPQITNYASHDFPHAHDCKAAGKVEARPWETFAQLLSPLTRALSGEKAGPVGDGYRAVPANPTPEMRIAGAKALKDHATFEVRVGGGIQAFGNGFKTRKRSDNLYKAKKCWEAMLAASPTPDKEGA